MAITIGENCIFCGACAEECPSGAIFEGQEIFEVDGEKCFECVGISGELLCSEVCPVRIIEAPAVESLEREPSLLLRAKELLPSRQLPDLSDLTEATSRFRRRGKTPEEESKADGRGL